ncbi:hypothetical protein GH741_12735 [Aquibacillus halophilus]|uniref:Uncharacterized protein n=1 Tax=Aquibacillus halophilus TaxID=930132 RepID=A0A6A8DG71_9BACI|nr:hypothetical protein [Aquibacillus halophilus]MRH43546.1 hypothetical protein [Aquibacillus halophilus]
MHRVFKYFIWLIVISTIFYFGGLYELELINYADEYYDARLFLIYSGLFSDMFY